MNIDAHGVVLGAHETWISDVVFSPDGTLLASSSGDGTTAIWRIDSREQLLLRKGSPGASTPAVFSPDGRSLITSADGGYLTLWDIETGTKRLAFGVNGKRITSLSMNAARSLICVGRQDGVIEVYDSPTGINPVRTLSIEAEEGVTVALSPDGTTLAASNLFSTVAVWDIASAQCELREHFSSDHPFSLAFTTGSRYLAIGGGGGIQIRDISEGRDIDYLPCGSEDIVFSLTYDAQHNWLVSGRGDDHDHVGAVDIWDLSANDRIATLSEDPTNSFSVVYAVAVNHDGSVIASGGDDNNIYLWTIK